MAVDLSALVFAIIDIVGVIGILVWHAQGKDRPTARLIVQILFFATMTATLLQRSCRRGSFRFE